MDVARVDRQLILRVLARIQEHTYSDPIKIRTLEEEFGISDRRIKRIVEELRQAGYKVGSHKTEPMGLFIAKYPEEIHPTAVRIEQEGVALIMKARRLRDFSGAEPTIFEQEFVVPPEGTGAGPG